MRPVLCLSLSAIMLASACRSTGPTSSGGILGASDETAAAGQLIEQANKDLTEIKVLYNANESKREDLKKALAADDAVAVKKISNEVINLINDGTESGESAVKKIQNAQEMEINDEFREYLRLKEESLKRQLEAFENYRKAAQSLRDNYDPKNTQLRDKVKGEFTQRAENYRSIMEEARDYSKRANELRKEVLRRQT